MQDIYWGNIYEGNEEGAERSRESWPVTCEGQREGRGLDRQNYRLQRCSKKVSAKLMGAIRIFYC